MEDRTGEIQVEEDELTFLKKEIERLRSQSGADHSRIYCDVALLEDCVIWICGRRMPTHDKSGEVPLLLTVHIEGRYEDPDLPEDQIEAACWCAGLMNAIYSGLHTLVVGNMGTRIYIHHRDPWFGGQLIAKENPFTEGSKLHDKFNNIIEVVEECPRPLLFQEAKDTDLNWTSVTKRLYFEVAQYLKTKKKAEEKDDTVSDGECIHQAEHPGGGE